MVETHDQISKEKHLARVGQTVRHKRHGTFWRVIEKREVWQNIPDDPKTGHPRLVPAVQLTFWQIKEGGTPGIGKMLGYAYTLHDNTFESNWEIVEG